MARGECNCGAVQFEIDAEGALVHRQVDPLTANGLGIEGDLERDLEFVGGAQGGALVPLHDLDGLQDLDIAARGVLPPAAGAVEDFDEGQRRAVHDRHLGAIELDDGIVDVQHDQSGHQVLDGGDRDVGGVGDHSAQLGLADRLGADRHAIVAIGHIGADEDDAGIGGRGPHRDTGMGAGVHADAGEDRRALQGVLKRGCGQDRSPLESQCWPGVARLRLSRPFTIMLRRRKTRPVSECFESGRQELLAESRRRAPRLTRETGARNATGPGVNPDLRVDLSGVTP